MLENMWNQYEKNEVGKIQLKKSAKVLIFFTNLYNQIMNLYKYDYIISLIYILYNNTYKHSYSGLHFFIEHQCIGVYFRYITSMINIALVNVIISLKIIFYMGELFRD